MNLAILTSFALLAVSPPNVLVKQRTLSLEPDQHGQQENITVLPGRWTVINFPETFDASAVLCVQCFDRAALPADTKERAALKHPWLIDKHPETNSIYVTTNRSPSANLPVEMFRTGLYVLMKGGFAADLQLSALDIMRTDGADLVADSVVTIEVPDKVTFNGQVKAKTDELEVKYKKLAKDEANDIAVKRQLGFTNCKRNLWKEPYSRDKMVVRLLQLCSNDAPSKSFWALLSVENLSDATLYLDSAELKPEAGGKMEAKSGGFTTDRLTFEQATLATVSYTLEPDVPVPSKWSISVRSKSSDRGHVKVEGIKF
jgi:hypothetical protein